MTRTLVLLRHGQTAWNAQGRAQGHLDVELDDTGRTQARAAASAIASLRPTVLWSSDLLRASATADEVARATGLRVQVDERLREYAVGDNRGGLTTAEYAAAHPIEHAALTAGDIAAIPGRETDDDLLARFLPALTSYADVLADGETGVLVSHGAALRIAVPAFLGWPEETAQTLATLDNCGWIELEYAARTWFGGTLEPRWRLAAWNRVAPDFTSAESVG